MNNQIILAIIISLLVCYLLHRVLKNRTIEVENFTNEPKIYTSDFKERF
jgi:lipopolysaccharide export system protein LptC